MKAIYPFGPKNVQLVDLPEPAPGAGQVLLVVRGSGICGSDKGLWRAEGPIEHVFGHEVAGEVTALGPGVRALRVGDRVAVNNVIGCGHCPACRAGAYVLCPNWRDENVDGGFGEYVVAPERNCMKLADELTWEEGCLIFDNFGTPFGGLETAGVTHADNVVVMGCGPIGLAAVILARLRGAYVIAVDPLLARRDFALSLDANAVFAPDADLPAAVRAVTSGAGASVVLECSGKPPSYPLGLASLAHNGRMVAIGEGGQMDLHPSDHLIRRHLALLGSWYSTMPQGRKVQELIRSGQIHPSILVTERGPLPDFPAMFAKVCERPDEVVKAVILNP